MLVLTRIQKAKRARRRDKVCRFASCDIGGRPGNRRGVLSQRSRITAPLLALTMLKVAEEFPRPINVANVITRSNGQPASAGDADLENTRSRGGTIADAQSRAQRSTDDGPARDGSAGGSRLLSAGGRTCVCPVAVSAMWWSRGQSLPVPGRACASRTTRHPRRIPMWATFLPGIHMANTVSAAIRGAFIVHISAIHMRSLMHQCRSGGTGLCITRGCRRAVRVQ
jgi:hypothetical protein